MENNFFIYVNFSEENDTQDYKYWFSFIKYFIKSADSIEFHLWNEEVETIKELSLKTDLKKICLDRLKMVSFVGDINQNLINYILEESLNNHGEVKWFSIFLKFKGNLFFESSHWGSEINIENPNENEINMIKSVLPKNATFHHFNNNESG
ncbi:hypothetical protein MKZ20_07880 [Psychrobacillus sp. FSL K6-2684]|uniref:hypothetical protein n=1 Tax=unclassified Psychrobacillus TaxID=2636677 RepID=UPI0011A67DC9|nr:hypothetical protein [Psychrobacillus sp. AK 1817]QEY20020.1 hypothetical protein D0S48_04555 [Psychrobacillus sp. AK 1817]